jgi:hypothetical protein
MSTEPTTAPQAPEATWGDPQPPAPKWSGKKTAVAAAIAVAIAAVGGVAIYAGTSANSSQQTGMGGPGNGRMGGFGNPMGGEMSLLRNALHGDFTVSENGSYVTERLQTGSVSALTATSITVKSTDNYEQTYTVDSSTTKPDNLATGSKITVIAKVSGDTATATSITDTAQNQRGMGGQQGGPGGMPGQQGGMPGGNQGGPPAN